jgi:nitrogen regulatory protein PII
LEIAADEFVVEGLVDAIVRAATTGGPGQIGDGKVFVVQPDE